MRQDPSGAIIATKTTSPKGFKPTVTDLWLAGPWGNRAAASRNYGPLVMRGTDNGGIELGKSSLMH